MLKINELKASVEEASILKGLNLTINPGEVHAIMGPTARQVDVGVGIGRP